MNDNLQTAELGRLAETLQDDPQRVIVLLSRALKYSTAARRFLTHILAGHSEWMQSCETEAALLAARRMLHDDRRLFRRFIDTDLVTRSCSDPVDAIRAPAQYVAAQLLGCESEIVLHSVTLEDGVPFECFHLMEASREAPTSAPGIMPSNVRMVGDVLVPCFKRTSASCFVPTELSTDSLNAAGRALIGDEGILVAGPTGSGKSFLVEQLAVMLGEDEGLVRIHLGDQTDAKMLLGTYTSSDQPGQFVWQPGVLLRAMTEGRWLLLEGLDRAPQDVLGLLDSLLEHRSVHIPGRDELINTCPGFKLFATVAAGSRSRLSGTRWTSLDLPAMTTTALSQILVARFPRLAQQVQTILRLAEAGSLNSREVTTHVILRLASRLDAAFAHHGIASATDNLTEALQFDMLAEAVDCLSSTLASVDERSSVTRAIGSVLNLPPERVQLYIDTHEPELREQKSRLTIGRVTVPKLRGESVQQRPFANTRHALRHMESILAAVKQHEPVLLVGETGTGKTTIVQQLASLLGTRLTVINLSQQTEAGDLIGGYKPLDARLLAVGLLDRLETLFARTMSASKNAKFLSEIRRAFSKATWTRFTTLLREASRIAMNKLAAPVDDDRRKRRRTDLMQAWQELGQELDAFARRTGTSSTQGFAFSFVEGSLIAAIRNGTWVLLDEINLASAETLEAIDGLLQDDPSVVLPEKGRLDPLRPHPDFRLFACMNPATDFGKRDLPAGVRSKFTEMYVDSPGADRRDLLKIVARYIGHLSVHDPRIINDVAELYVRAGALLAANRLVDGAGQKPHYSIRTLSRTLVFASGIHEMYGLRRALYEAFSMAYLTVLDATSEAILEPLVREFTIGRLANAKAALTLVPPQPTIPGPWTRFEHYWLACGDLETFIDEGYVMTASVHRNLLNLVRAVSTRRLPILLQGPTSAGKTSMIEYLAKRTGHPFVRINNHEHTDLQEYLGSYASDTGGNLVFQEGVLVKAIREGAWLVLDELNLAPPDVLEALNRLLDDNRELLIPDTQEIVRPHPHFTLFATQNPAGLYGGRKHLSRAFRNRFLELHFDDIPQNELEVILCNRCRIAPSYAGRIVEVYRQLQLRRDASRIFESKHSFATLRDLFRWANRPAVGNEELAVNGFYLLAEKARREDERTVVREVLEATLRVTLPTDLYPLDTKTLDTSLVWTSPSRRLFKLIYEAFRNDEAVLLVGETGAGKTRICQAVAEALDRRITILNAHQNTETGDLIGSQRPIRDRASQATILERGLREWHRTKDLASDGDLQDLVGSFSAVGVSDTSAEACRLRSSIASVHALFHWVDGPLITSMKDGDAFLLDEISLAEDSVLERLNSVLETGRSILLAEKGDGELVLAHPDFRFCATMNPGGDFGKKELSPALRNRFTEIWVPALSATKDMTEIVQSKLTKERRHFAQIMVSFAAYMVNRRSGPLDRTTISIRDLLAWCEFCNIPTYTPDQALVQGAALLFRDLDADALAELANLSGIANLADLLVVGDVRLENGIFAIGNFAIPSSAAQLDSSFDLSATTTRSNASRVLRAMQLRKPILLEGSPGVGKTSLVTAIARAAGQSLVRINFSEQTDLMDLFGSDMPVDSEADSISFAWRPAAFLRAMQSGAWVLLDEMNLATQSILEGLNACLDHRGEAFIPELNRAFDCHPNFRVFAAQNPHSQGGGRKGLPKSFVNRFTVVYCDELSLEDELQICRNVSKHKDVDRVLQFAMNVRSKITQDTAFASVGAPWDFNLRDALRWVQLLETFPNAPAAYFGDMLIKQRLRTSEDKAVLQALLDSHFEPFTRHACAAITRNELRIDRAYLPRACAGAVPSGIAIAHVGMAESIMFSVQLAWPVLLAGPSASGKSTLIRSLAGLLGRNLVEISMNQDMDSSDLLGSFEQTDFTRRYHRHIQDLRDLIRPDARLEHTGLMERLATRSDEPETLQLIRRLAPQLSSKIDAAEALLPQLAQQSRGSFEWVEGALVRAVKTGSWLVLDNANRCPASVLDRLNSLLEPAGRLTINERVDGDGNPLVIEPHPAFRLFLTSNPVNGELSRAMRNRCVELWIDRPESFDSIFESAQAEESNDFGLWRAGPSYALIPALTSRHSLRHFRTEQWDDVDHVRRVCGTNVNFFDRLQVYRASKVTLDKTLQKFTGKAARGIVERLRQAMTNPTPAVAQLLLFADRILPLDGRIEVLAAFANAFDRALHKDDPERPGARQVELWQALRGLHPPTQAAFEHHTTLRHYLHAIEQMSSHTEAAALAVNALRILNRLCEVTCDDIRIPSVNLSHPMRSNTDRDPLADRLLLAAELRLLSKKSAESDHESLTSIAILARRPLETLAPFFAPLSTVANILAASGNAVELSLAIPSLQGTMASWLAQRYTRDNVALDEYDVADARRRTIDGEMARSLASLSIRPAAVVGRVANLILPGLDLIEFAVEFVRAYLPVTPTDPAAEIEIQSKMRSWSIAQLNELLSAARHAHKCIHGRPDSPFIDRLTQEISHAQAVMVTVAHVVRPVQSQLLELHAEFEYVRQLLHMEALDSPARSTAIRGNLLRVRQRLRSFTMYQDLVAPLLAVLAILELALLERERSQERDKLESSPTFPVSPLTLVSIGPERYDAPAGELDLLRQSQFALEWIKFTRSSSSPEQLVHDLSAKWFQAFFIARELEAKRSAEQGSLYKGFEEEMDEEAAIKELFPDYEAESSHPSQSSGLDTLRLDAFQQLASFWSGTAEPSSLTELIRLATKAALESRATLGEDPQLLHAAAVHLATKAGSVTAYDFYRDPDKPKALLLRGLLLPLRYRVTELRDEWPENAVLDDLLDSINALLAMSVASPIAQLLTMAEQVFVKVAGWQETAARHVSLVTHFEAIRNLVVSWRRYELGCWPQLLDVEDRRALEADTKAYYHLFELLVFAPLRHSENDYVTMALGLLFEFMRKSTLAQFPRRCLYIQGFAKHLTWLSASGKISTTWAEAVCHVSRYFSRSTQPVMATLAAEKKIFSKEVYQTMKLASWKDTNVYALRESARRSHRTLYKVIRKYRSLLARPVLPELEKEFAFQRSARFVASMPEVLPMPAVGLPDRYQHPSRTIARLARISAVERPENAIAGLLSDATMTARELRNATPKEATEEALKQIKHLKTRKRKLLADSLRELRRLGLRTSTQPAVAAAQADQISVIRNTRCLASVDGTFDQVIQILPKVREVLFSHSEDLTINEIRRATGLFDALLDRSRRNLALLADAFEMLEQLRKSAARFCQLSQLDSWSPVAPTQLREVSSYVQSVTRYLCFLPVSIGGMASVGELRYEEPATWRSILADFERIQSVLVPELAVLDPQTADTISGLPEVISHTRGAVSDIQSACPELAPMYDELLVLLSQCPAPEVRGVSSQPVREELLLDMADGFLVAAQKLDGLDWSEVSTLEGDWHDRYHKVASERIACLLRPSLIRKASRIADDLSSTSCTSTNVLQHIAPVIAAYAAVAAREVDTFCAIHEETLKNTYSVARTLVSLGQEGFCGPSEGEATSSSAANAQASDGTGLGDGQGQKDVSETLDDDEEIDLADAQPPEAGQDNSENDDRQDAREQADDFVGDLEDVPQSDEDSVESDGQEDATDDLDEEIGEVDDLDPSALDEKMWDGEQEELREKETDKQNARGESDLVDKATDDGDDEPSADSADDADADDEQASMADDTDPPPSDQNGVEQDKELPPPAQNLDLPDDIKMDDEIETEDAGDVEETVDVDEPEDVNTPMEDPKNDATENESETGEEAEATTPQDSSITAPESLEDEQEDAKMQDADSAAGDGQDFQEDDAVDAAEHGAKAGAPTERQADMLDDPQHDEHPSSTNEGALQSLASHHDAEMSASRELMKQEESVRTLGDALEHYRRLLHIAEAQSQSEQQGEVSQDGTSAEVEHVGEEENHQSQALGPSENTEIPPIPQMEAEEKETREHGEAGGGGGDAAPSDARDIELMPIDEVADQLDNQSDENGSNRQEAGLEATGEIIRGPEAVSDWRRHIDATRSLSHALSEQLRLVLEPTLATKLQGDYRTGKRLNMRRIIPYVASQFKKDKIWLRRTKPSKRQYQVMLSVDDSHSMADCGATELAYQSISLISSALSTLESGEFALVGFGEQPRILHRFEDAFQVSDKLFDGLTFSQGRTNIRALMDDSLKLFRHARQRSEAALDLWQLQLILSDGLCEDHEGIRTVLRQMHEERILVVFVVLDSRKDSILKMRQVKYDQGMTIRSYMESFPFEQRILIRDLSELPALLCSILRQFFSET